jgi:hypothetical protein
MLSFCFTNSSKSRGVAHLKSLLQKQKLPANLSQQGENSKAYYFYSLA